MEETILKALRDFSFSNYGCDDIDEFMNDEDLEIAPDLAAHIASYFGGES